MKRVQMFLAGAFIAVGRSMRNHLMPNGRQELQN